MQQHQTHLDDRIQCLFKDINELREEHDISHEEMCNQMIDDSPLHTSNQSFGESSIHSVKHLQQQSAHPLIQENKQLRTINSKLFQDNQCLLKQCVKLKKASLSIHTTPTPKNLKFQEEKVNELKIQNLHLSNEIAQLRTENLKLKAEIYAIEGNQSLTVKHTLKNELENITKQCMTLSRRIDEIWKSNLLKKNESFHSTTFSSKPQQIIGKSRFTERRSMKKKPPKSIRTDQSPQSPKPTNFNA